MQPTKSSKKSLRSGKQMGRPPKGDGPAGCMMAVRFTQTDRALLDAIIEDEQTRLNEQGSLVVRLAVADVLRALVRQEARRRGLIAGGIGAVGAAEQEPSRR